MGEGVKAVADGGLRQGYDPQAIPPSGMGAAKSEAGAKNAVRQALEPVLERQEEHPVWDRFAVDWREPHGMNRLTVLAAGNRVEMSLAELDAQLRRREQEIAKQRLDPYRYGYEPAIWRETDWRLAELRLARPGDPVVLAVLGGNGGGKSYYMGKRYDMAMVENRDWLCFQLSLDQSSSREVPQRIIYSHLPQELRSATGKKKKTVATKLSYNLVNGFTDDTFGLENECRSVFKFYGGGDVNSMEGPRPDLVWADEMVPVEWVRAAKRRLMTKAEKSKALIPEIEKALAARRAAMEETGISPWEREQKLEQVWREHLRPILPRLFQGVCMISFTPKNGYTRTVAMLTAAATTLSEVEAELLPITREGEVIGYEKVPRVQFNEEEDAVIVYFHVYDNPFGGNWAGQKRDLAKRSRDEKLWRAYGVATKVAGVQFPLFHRSAHVRVPEMLPDQGTWYHIVDPCTDGRNWFQIWFKVCPNPVGKPLIWIAREWPQPDDWIVAGGVGNPGAWATLDDSGQADGKKKSATMKHDGERGPAQNCWGLGYRQYAEEIERVERELYREDRRASGDPAWADAEGRIEIGLRIMDSRGGRKETQGHMDSISVIEHMAEYDLHFVSAGRDSGAEAGTTVIKEGVGMINDRLFYDREQADLLPNGTMRFHGQAPSLFVSSRCKNLIFCMTHWTGMDGLKGAMKDPIDCVRYGVIANPEHLGDVELTSG